MHKTIEYTKEILDAFDLEARGLNGEAPRNRAEWARMTAVEIKKQSMTRSKSVAQPNGEAVPPQREKISADIPDLAAVEASLDRSRLLLQSGTDVAAMALDAANSIQASNSLERMLAHQMAAVHKQAMEQMGQVPYERNAADQAKRLNAAARCMTVYQQGILALHKVRRNGQQRIMVQYVNVSDGSQAIIGSFATDAGGDVDVPHAMPTQ